MNLFFFRLLILLTVLNVIGVIAFVIYCRTQLTQLEISNSEYQKVLAQMKDEERKAMARLKANHEEYTAILNTYNRVIIRKIIVL